MSVGAILLAAGSARRMGSDKLAADLGGRPLALHAFEAILAAGIDRPIVAVAPGSALAALFAGRARLVMVEDHALGMGHSLAAAIAAAPGDWSAAIIGLADMPFVRPETLRALAAASAPDGIVRPVFSGIYGNPVAWGRDHFPALARLRGDKGGRDILARHPPTPLVCDDPGVTIDIDTPDALAAARAKLL
nr:nucleotidyltransferase family protein [Sphingomonas sp. Y57]